MKNADGRRYAEAKLRLSEKEFWALAPSTRHKIMEQLMFVLTNDYLYCIGTVNNLWTTVKYDIEPEYDYKYGQMMPTGKKLIVEGEPEIVEKWH